MDAILKLHEQIQDTKLGANRKREIAELETAALDAPPDLADEGPAAVSSGGTEGEDARRLPGGHRAAPSATPRT